jgi:signal transduction histidine kinase
MTDVRGSWGRAEPSARAVARIGLRFAVALRWGAVLAACLAASVGPGAGIERSWQAGVLAALLVWAAIFTVWTRRRGLTFWPAAADTAVVSLALLAQERYVPAAAFGDETTWSIMLASSSIYVVLLGLRPWPGVPLSAVVIAAYTVGAPIVTGQVRILYVQVIAVSAIMGLLRQGGRRADAAVAESERSRRQAVLAAARRADEAEHRARLHDSVLATLTMVATGAVDPRSPKLRSAARQALAVMDETTAPLHPPGTAEVDLAERLRTRLGTLPVTLEIALTAPPMAVPEPVAMAMTGAAGEALRNVERHAQVTRAAVRAHRADDGRVTVEVVDQGRGFDPARVPPARQGIQESIVRRMAAVGGTGRVASTPGRGTRVVLGWPDG